MNSLFHPLEIFADGVARLLGLDPLSAGGAAVAFFVYELIKVSLLILAISWVMGLVRSSLPLEAMRRWLGTPAGRLLGYPAAAVFGAITPFCSCSSVPLFIGFIEARLPVGIAMAFLITSPLVNEIVVALFIASFGWKTAALYVVSGCLLGIMGGWLLQRMRAERWLSAFARELEGRATEAPGGTKAVSRPDRDSAGGCCGDGGCVADAPKEETSWAFASREAREIYVGVLPYLVVALVIGAGIHGFVPEQFFARYFSAGNWWDVPAAVLAGFPLYASANATVPVLQTLVEKGVPLGTGMAFIMAAVGVSLPELVLLRRVMTVRLLVIYSLVVSVGVMLVGWLFNAVAAWL